MLILPPNEELAEKVGNKYKLCILSAKRAKFIQKDNIEKEIKDGEKELNQAVREIYEGTVVIDEEV